MLKNQIFGDSEEDDRGGLGISGMNITYYYEILEEMFGGGGGGFDEGEIQLQFNGEHQYLLIWFEYTQVNPATISGNIRVDGEVIPDGRLTYQYLEQYNKYEISVSNVESVNDSTLFSWTGVRDLEGEYVYPEYASGIEFGDWGHYFVPSEGEEEEMEEYTPYGDMASMMMLMVSDPMKFIAYVDDGEEEEGGSETPDFFNASLFPFTDLLWAFQMLNEGGEMGIDEDWHPLYVGDMTKYYATLHKMIKTRLRLKK